MLPPCRLALRSCWEDMGTWPAVTGAALPALEKLAWSLRAELAAAGTAEGGLRPLSP